MNKPLKNILIGIGVLVAGVVAIILFYVLRPAVPIEDILPNQTIVFAKIKNPVDRWHSLKGSGFWKTVANIDIPLILAKNHVPESRIKELGSLSKDIEQMMSNKVFEKMLGTEIGLAISEVAKGQYQVAIFSRVFPLVGLMERFSNAFDHWGENISTTKTIVDGQTIVEVKAKGKAKSFVYTRISNIMVLTQENNEFLKEIIKVAQGQAPTLSRESAFLSFKSHLYLKAEGLAYLNLEQLVQSLAKNFSDKALKQSGFKAYAVSYLPGNIDKYKMVVTFNEQKLDPSTLALFKCNPKDNGSLAFVPPSVMAYQWSGCYDFKYLTNEIKNNLTRVEEIKDKRIRKRLQKALNPQSMDDLGNILGTQAGGYLTEVDTQGLFPYPRFLAFLQVSDEQKMADIIANAIPKNPLGKIKQETYNNVVLNYVTFPLGANMDPGYAFLNKYLLISSSTQLLKKSIDVFNDKGAGLGADKTFKSLGLDTGSSQSLLYLNVGDFSQRIKGLVQLGLRFYSSQVAQMAILRDEREQTKEALAAQLAEDSDQLELAKTKLVQWSDKDPATIAPEEMDNYQQTLDNLKKQVEALEESIKNNRTEQQNITEEVRRFDKEVANSKLFIFNVEQIAVPILKGFADFGMLGIKMWHQENALVTEMMLN